MAIQPILSYLKRAGPGGLRSVTVRDLPPQVGDTWQVGADPPLTVIKVGRVEGERQGWTLTLSDGVEVEAT
jgi:hypothetical protein